MKILSYLSLSLLCLLSAVSCIKEDLDACPPEGGSVAVTIRVEKFRTRPPYAPEDLEENVAARIHSLNYMLYANGRLLEQGRLDDMQAAEGNTYVYRHDPLPFGAYRLVFVANVTARMMTGNPDAPENYYIVYQGEGKGDDHLRADLPFEVTCPCSNAFETVLQRVHGVTRFRFEQIPPEITSIEVSLDEVGQRTPLAGEPDLPCTVAKRVALADWASRTDGAFTLGTFSTLPGARTSWRLKLYAGDETVPVYDRMVTDTLRIERNQLLELTTRFKEDDFRGDIDFSVDVDTDWDGSNEGGGEVVIL